MGVIRSDPASKVSADSERRASASGLTRGGDITWPVPSYLVDELREYADEPCREGRVDEVLMAYPGPPAPEAVRKRSGRGVGRDRGG